jgi:hypothetical protein
MQPGMGLHRYTGTAPIGPWRGMGQPGHCRQCGQPSGSCCCGCRECRKEAKELLVTPDTTGRGALSDSMNAAVMSKVLNLGELQDQANANAGTGTAFIGGGCCVTLAVEYAPSVATATSVVLVAVKDSEGTALIWARSEPAGTGYRVHECIITTKPGATLVVDVLNCTARVRWCEVFSCC